MKPGDRLKKARTELKLTTRELAGALGVSQSVVSEWESNKMAMRQPNAMSIELLYGISWKWLMTGDGSMWTLEVPDWVARRIQGGELALPEPPEDKVTPGQRLAAQQAPPMDATHQAALQLAIAHCQANQEITDPAALVAAFRDILQRLQS